jgi:hypothetical protein
MPDKIHEFKSIRDQGAWESDEHGGDISKRK